MWVIVNNNNNNSHSQHNNKTNNNNNNNVDFSDNKATVLAHTSWTGYTQKYNNNNIIIYIMLQCNIVYSDACLIR